MKLLSQEGIVKNIVAVLVAAAVLFAFSGMPQAAEKTAVGPSDSSQLPQFKSVLPKDNVAFSNSAKSDQKKVNDILKRYTKHDGTLDAFSLACFLDMPGSVNEALAGQILIAASKMFSGEQIGKLVSSINSLKMLAGIASFLSDKEDVSLNYQNPTKRAVTLKEAVNNRIAALVIPQFKKNGTFNSDALANFLDTTAATNPKAALAIFSAIVGKLSETEATAVVNQMRSLSNIAARAPAVMGTFLDTANVNVAVAVFLKLGAADEDNPAGLVASNMKSVAVLNNIYAGLSSLKPANENEAKAQQNALSTIQTRMIAMYQADVPAMSAFIEKLGASDPALAADILVRFKSFQLTVGQCIDFMNDLNVLTAIQTEVSKNLTSADEAGKAVSGQLTQRITVIAAGQFASNASGFAAFLDQVGITNPQLATEIMYKEDQRHGILNVISNMSNVDSLTAIKDQLESMGANAARLINAITQRLQTLQ